MGPTSRQPVAYQRATQVMHLAVRQQGSPADREWIVRKAPGVAARAALGLARSGALDDALVTLETGRAVLLTEMFDRRALDYQRIASLAGDSVADDYRRLTDVLTECEARLLLTEPQGDRAATAAAEETRKRMSALRARARCAKRPVGAGRGAHRGGAPASGGPGHGGLPGHHGGGRAGADPPPRRGAGGVP
jgi:hypothetical protein